MADLMTFSAYARRRGWSQPYVSQLVAKGVIPLAEGRKIDPDAADAAIAALRDPAKQPVADRHAAARRQSPKDDAPAPAAPPLGGAPVGQFHQAKTATEVFRAKQARLSYDRAVGLLIETDQAVRAINANVGPTVKLLDGIVDRIASRLAAETDPRKVHAMLSAEVDAVKQEIARVARGLIERLTAAQQ